MKTAVRKALLAPATFINTNLLYTSRMAMCCARGALNAATHRPAPHDPSSWEFSAFSQNGEDGIITELLTRLKSPCRYFVEIGAADGLENNSAYLAFVKKYNGIMVEGDPFHSSHAKKFLWAANHGVRYLNLFVEPDTVGRIVDLIPTRTPDLFSLDIDGMDYHVAKSLFATGFRPGIVCVEYNAAYGPEAVLTIPYQRAFDYTRASATHLYYGVSIAGWRRFFARLGYDFVTVESKGVNAFFIDPVQVDLEVSALARCDFAENCAHQYRYPGGWVDQWARISALPMWPID